MTVDQKEREAALAQYLGSYRRRLDALLDSLSIEGLAKVVSVIVEAYRNDKTIYICGNGGSAATASHMQVDFGFFIRNFKKRRIRVRSLTDNVPMLTAVGNDFSYEDIFTQQMQDHFQAGDVLIGISASGNSMNVVNAVEYANELGGTTIGFVGFTGGKLKDACQIAIHTPNEPGDYGPIEDLHMFLDHFLVTYLAEDKEFIATHE